MSSGGAFPHQKATLESIGIGELEMAAFMNSNYSGIGDEDRQICLCGHQMSRHQRSDAVVYCSVSRAWCDCARCIYEAICYLEVCLAKHGMHQASRT